MISTRPAFYGSMEPKPSGDYSIVALRMEFQPDTSRFTTGDGTFSGDLFDDGLAANVDPLPHDSGYFQAHLDFLSHYIERVSDGLTTVTTHLVPGVVQLSGDMSAYSPIGEDADSDDELAKLVSMVAEAWGIADASIDFDVADLDPERTAFVIFHAGVGRDIELIGTTLDKTPFDLPSLFFDEAALQRLAPGGLPSFKGMDISSSILMPRTETRQGTDFINDTKFLAEFSINGLLAASFLNYLGAPDLFDTNTGNSAIGPFGLMDPLGIFAFNGLFPPEPSAWIKAFLGWAGPVTYDTTTTVSLNAVSSELTSQTARFNISPAEYFLVENRHRDAVGDGLRMKIWKNGQITEQIVQVDDESFNSRTVDGFAGGVVVAVDNYDWALPGGVDENGTVYNGGILIWHIDENVILDSIGANAINANPDRRGVDLEEADSGQDLGFPPLNPFAPPFDLGTPFDYFFEGNPVEVVTASGNEVMLYENRFAYDTFPNSNNNLGGPSPVALSSFSVTAPVMTFEFSPESFGSLMPRPGFATDELTIGTSNGGQILRFGSDGEYLAVQHDDPGAVSVLDGRSGGLRLQYSASISTVSRNDELVVVNSFIDANLVATIVGETSAPRTLSLPVSPILFNAALRPPLIAVDDGYAARFATPQISGVLVFDETSVSTFEIDARLGRLVGLAASVDSLLFIGSSGMAWSGGNVTTYESVGDTGPAIAAIDNTGPLVAAVASAGNSIEVRHNAGSTSISVPTSAGNEAKFNKRIAAADLNDDGQVEIIATAGSMLVGYSRDGAVFDGFPINIGAPSEVRPLVTLDRPGEPAIVVGGVDGYLREFRQSAGGRWVVSDSTPLSIGSSIRATPLVTDSSLVVVSTGGALHAFDRTSPVQPVWAADWGDVHGSNLVVTVRTDLPSTSESLISENETYNWPNPVRSGLTNLRVGVASDSDVTVTIINRAGTLIERIMLGQVSAGIPREIEWRADVESGVYFGKVEATTADGQTETRLIKIAVIR